jgi:hypothetical protein
MTRSIFWLIRYFFIALKCPIPVVEVFWIHSDRNVFETERLLPRLKYQLVDWEYTHDKHANFRYWRGLRNLILHQPLVFYIRTDDGSLHVWSVSIGYPRNLYSRRSLGFHEQFFDSRTTWLRAMLGLIEPSKEISPFILNPNVSNPQQLWLSNSRIPAEWIEIQ